MKLQGEFDSGGGRGLRFEIFLRVEVNGTNRGREGGLQAEKSGLV